MAKKACDLCGVTTLLTGEPHLGRLIAELRAGRSRQVYGLPSSAHAVTTAALARALGVPVLLVTGYADIREAVLVAVTRTHNSPRAFRSAGNASLALILPDLLLARSAQNDVPPFVGMTDHRRRSGRS